MKKIFLIIIFILLSSCVLNKNKVYKPSLEKGEISNNATQTPFITNTSDSTISPTIEISDNQKKKKKTY